ncbi:hypothetical protein Csa_022146 [Cucumis sativus]|nr:hypothetical protein Csa_022146 [Cucumis sativus]
MSVSRSQLNLSRDEMIKKIFEEYDVDGDGTLTKQEVMQAMDAMGFKILFQMTQFGISFADRDDDGKVDQDELEKLIDCVISINRTTSRVKL